jgi:DNA-directed RNA polymerase specialized sigma24 family protein
MISDPLPNPQWILEKSGLGHSEKLKREVRAAALRAWPHVLRYGLRELKNKTWVLDREALIVDAWEKMLTAVARMLRRNPRRGSEIEDLQAYLMSSFQRRFHRVLERECNRRQSVRFVPLSRECDTLKVVEANGCAFRKLDRLTQAREQIEQMDEWLRTVWFFKESDGYSFKAIGKVVGCTERETKDRYYYALKQMRQRARTS